MGAHAEELKVPFQTGRGTVGTRVSWAPLAGHCGTRHTGKRQGDGKSSQRSTCCPRELTCVQGGTGQLPLARRPQLRERSELVLRQLQDSLLAPIVWKHGLQSKSHH